MPHIKIIQPGETYFGTTIEIDGQKINGVRNIDYHVGVDGKTGVNIHVIGTAGVDLEADYVKLTMTPNNIQSAVEILRYSLSKDNPHRKHYGVKNELREAFIDSIFSAIDEYTREMDLPIIDKPTMAEKILDRLLGDEEQ